MFHKKLVNLFIVFLILYLLPVDSDAQWLMKKVDTKPKDYVSIVAFYSNLMGIGLGCSYRFNRSFDVTLSAGGASPYHILWTTPYTGNAINFGFNARLYHRLGFFISAGGYAGMHNITQELLFWNDPMEVWTFAPTVSVGVEYPSHSKRQISLELGSAIGLPKTIVKDGIGELASYAIRADRSVPSFGSFFPFLQIAIKI